jgi:inner membrane protein
VQTEIHQLSGGEQRVTGPYLLVPAEVTVTFTDEYNRERQRKEQRTIVFLPQVLNVDTDIDTDIRSRSIYEATVYTSATRLSGTFANLAPPQNDETVMDWASARLVVGLNDITALKGVRGAPSLMVDGVEVETAFTPGIQAWQGMLTKLETMTAPGLSVGLSQISEDGFSFELNLTLSGGGSFGVAALGRETRMSATSDWPHPSFRGTYIPDPGKEITDDGFKADWTVSYLARNLPQSFYAHHGLSYFAGQQMMEVGFVAPGSPYQKIDRSLKYALMFMGLIFLTVFLIELAMKSRAHPVQYVLIGLAQVVFYLLVLALSEHIGFDRAFKGTAVATVLLSGIYAMSVFRKVVAGLFAAVAFAGVYALIYLLMRSEDYALVIGSCTAFVAIAVTMFATRNIDWYGGMHKAQEPEKA